MTKFGKQKKNEPDYSDMTGEVILLDNKGEIVDTKTTKHALEKELPPSPLTEEEKKERLAEEAKRRDALNQKQQDDLKEAMRKYPPQMAWFLVRHPNGTEVWLSRQRAFGLLLAKSVQLIRMQEHAPKPGE